MEYTPESIARLRSNGRLEHARLAALGMVRDLARDEVTADVGKPVGSISGWVGPLFWQVWLAFGDAAGTVRARVDHGEAQLWTFEPAAPEPLLEAAKNRVIAEVQSVRTARLRAAEAQLAVLSAE